MGGRVERSEQYILYTITALPLATSAVLLGFGVDPLITALTGLLLFWWPFYVMQEQPPASEDPEYGFLRNLRGRLYVAGLLLAIPLNGVVFFYSIFLAPIVVLAVGASLSTVFGLMSRGPLRAINPAPGERQDFKEMVSKVGGGAIYLSMMLLWVDVLSLVVKLYGAGAIVSVVVLLLISFLQAKQALDRESSSRSHARSLAVSLRKRNWWRQFEASKRHVRKKRTESQS